MPSAESSSKLNRTETAVAAIITIKTELVVAREIITAHPINLIPLKSLNRMADNKRAEKVNKNINKNLEREVLKLPLPTLRRCPRKTWARSA